MAEEVHFWRIVRDESGEIKTWRLVDANPPALKTWGRATIEEIRGKTTDEIFGPGATEHYRPVVEKIMAEGVHLSFDDYFPHLDKHFRFISVPLGEHFITTGMDITSIKKVELALRDSEARFRLAIEHSQLMAWQCDTQMRFIWVYNSHFGVPDNDMIGKTFAELGIGESMKEFIAQSQEVLAEGAGVRRVISQVLPDGQEEHFDQQVEPVRDAQGIITGLVGISLNVTDRVRAEQLVHRSEEGYRLMIEHSTEPMLLVDESGRIDCISGKGARLLGFDQADLVDTCVDRFLDWSAKLDLLMRVQDFRKHAPMPARGVLRIRQGNGGWCWIDLHAGVVNYGQRRAK
jgi:PAS domain S-box-containing protein